MNWDRDPVWVERKHTVGEAVGTALVLFGTLVLLTAALFCWYPDKW